MGNETGLSDGAFTGAGKVLAGKSGRGAGKPNSGSGTTPGRQRRTPEPCLKLYDFPRIKEARQSP